MKKELYKKATVIWPLYPFVDITMSMWKNRQDYIFNFKGTNKSISMNKLTFNGDCRFI